MTLAEKLSRLSWGGCDYPTYEGQLKGDSSKAEMARANKLQDQQQQLMRQRLGMFDQQIAPVNASLDQMISSGGMLPSQEAALNSITMNTLPATFNREVGQINNQLVQRGITGGQMAGSGDIARNYGQLAAMEGALQQQGLSNVQLQKAQQLFNSLGMRSGTAGMNIGLTDTFNNGQLGALNMGVQAAHNVDQAQSNPWGSILGAGLSLGTRALGNWNPGGLFGGSNG